MLSYAVLLAILPAVFASVGMDLLLIGWITLTVIICAAIPLVTGMQKGYVGLGIVGALITIPFAVVPALGCISGLLAAIACSLVIQIIPKVEKPLLSQAEIEAETRRMRGY
jgi:hypothetical protein